MKSRSFYKNPIWVASLLAALLPCSFVMAEDVNITAKIPYIDLLLNGKTIRIERIQDTDNLLPKSFAKTALKCPPICIQPMKAAASVETVGKLKLLQFLKSHVEKGKGLLVDARLPAWYKKGTIPGAVNIPFIVLAPRKNGNNEQLEAILKMLGAKQLSNSEWNFSDALPVLMFCNGAWCDQSPRAIRHLLSAGYPPDKLLYYRGGFQMQFLLGLTITTPHQEYSWRNLPNWFPKITSEG